MVPHARQAWVLVVGALAAATPQPVRAQDLGGDAYARVWFVPRLRGALSLEGGLGQPIRIAADSGYPSTWFAGLGYKHYLEAHGRLQLRVHATYERGGVLNPSLEGTSNRFGVVGALTLRGISPEWFFGQIGVIFDASYLTVRPAAAPFGGSRPTTGSGSQFGGGVETTFGSMFVLDPYLMAETGASVTLSRVQLGPAETWEVWARWVVRLDWGIRRSE